MASVSETDRLHRHVPWKTVCLMQVVEKMSFFESSAIPLHLSSAMTLWALPILVSISLAYAVPGLPGALRKPEKITNTQKNKKIVERKR
jgi:hypothetical protein